MLLRLATMRAVWLFVLVAACGIEQDRALGVPSGSGSGFGSGTGGNPAALCGTDADCVLASATCCECPTFALPVEENQAACGQVDCGGPVACPDNVVAKCGSDHTCGLACKPLECDLTCDIGFVIDATGCLTCACADKPTSGCTTDSDCVETQADCCGCENGGEDTAVLAADAQSAIDNLMCPPSPICPGTYTCKAGAAPACIQSRCELLTPDERTKPVNECGVVGDQPCHAGEVCTINAVGPATARGVGVCLGP